MYSANNDISKLKIYISFASIFLLNFFLKIYYLDSQPIWFDESISIKATLLHFGHVKHMSEWDNNPPFYYYCLWVWTKLFGISEFGVRSMSVIFISLGASILFVFINKYFNYVTALGIALLYSVNNYLHYYSHETRAYALIVLLVLISTVIYFRFIETKSKLSMVELGLVNFLIVYTHYIAALVIFFQFILIIFYHREKFRLYSLSVIIMIILVFLRFTKKQFLNIFSFSSEGKTFWLKKADAKGLLETLDLFSGNKILVIIFGALILITLTVILLKTKFSTSQNFILIYSLILGPVSIGLLFVIGLLKPVFLDRYLIFSVPFILISIGAAIIAMPKWFITIFPIIIGLSYYSLNFNPSRNMDFKLSTLIVKKLRLNKPNTLVILQTKDITGLFTYYYNRTFFLNQETQIMHLNQENIFDIGTLNDLNSLNYSAEKEIILCQSFVDKNTSDQMFKQFLKNGYISSFSDAVPGIKLSVLKKKF